MRLRPKPMLDCKGNFVPLPSPFSDDGMTLSEIRIARMVRWYLNAGAEGFVVCTETGEFSTLSFSERKTMLEFVLRETRGTVPVLANVSSLSTAASIDLAQSAGRHGARGVVIMPPYYGDFTADETLAHLHAVSAYGKVPVILVDPQGKVTPEIQSRLADWGNVAVAEPNFWRYTRSDAFTCGGISVQPWMAASPSQAADPNVLEALKTFAAAKVAKAALEIQNLDLGSPRPPMRRLTGELAHSLQETFAPSSTRLSA